MKTIKLVSMTIQNFKGIKNLKIDFSEFTDIFGDNDSGKTTIYDAFLWGMFHKDSKDRAQFDWKPLDEKGDPIEGLQTSVKITLSINDTEKIFEKIKISKKVLKKKLEMSVYEDTTKYLIDGLETTTKTMYDTKVAEILDQEKFKNLTSITYFSEQLTAGERREKLFEYFGTKTDEEIIKEHENLKPLIEVMGPLMVNEARQRILQEQKQVNETLKSIPIKIEGIQAAMPEIADLDRSGLSDERRDLSKKKADLTDELSSIKNGGSIAETKSQLRVAKSQLEEAKLSYQNTQSAKLNGIEQGKAELFAKIDEAKAMYRERTTKRSTIEHSIERNKSELNTLEEKKEELYSAYDEIQEREFVPGTFDPVPFDETSLKCAYCGTEYADEKKDELREHHQAEENRRFEAFNAEQEQSRQTFRGKQALDESTNIEQGKANNAAIEEVKEEILDLQVQLADKSLDTSKIEPEIDKMEEELSFVGDQIKKLESERTPFEDTSKYKSFMKDIEFLNKTITDSQSTMKEQIEKQEAKIEAVETDIEVIDKKLATISEYDRQQGVIETFNDQEREFSTKKGEILEKLALFEEFFVTKKDLLQDHINSHFSLVQWKLFDFYSEGGLDESVCEPMINGIPFSGLNNGSRMQAGLDVSNTLMKQEGFLVPIFIDNAEGMTGHKRDEVKVDTQVIAMYVSEKDKNLRIINKGEDK